jgi:hypothetical protein
MAGTFRPWWSPEFLKHVGLDPIRELYGGGLLVLGLGQCRPVLPFESVRRVRLREIDSDVEMNFESVREIGPSRPRAWS